MDALPEKLKRDLEEAADCLREHLEGGGVARVVTHHDADGLSAGAIVHTAVTRAGYPCSTRCVKQLEEKVIAEIAAEKPELLILTDFGSGQVDLLQQHLSRARIIVLDHHQPREGAEAEPEHHINAHSYGIDGSREVSGSGMAYFFARTFLEALEKSNCFDLAALAVVGAVGDLQESSGAFHGLNRLIIKDGERAGVLRVEKDLRLFGRQTRPLYKAIEYTTEPFIPGLSGSESASLQFLSELEIPVKRDERFVMLADLTQEERQRLTTALILKMIEHRVPPHIAESIVGEVVTLLGEEKRTPLRDAKEFATLLNACGKHEHYGIGLAVCLGERGELYRRALAMLRKHREYLNSCYGWITQNLERIRDEGAVYSLHAGEEIDENVIGTVAGMVLNSRILEELKPIIAFAQAEDGEVKVSARGNRELVERGINLGKAMLYASELVAGEGGGHDVAAGAKIPRGKEEEFLRYVEEKIREQLSEGS
ncbi:MAG: DHH family phosphoesterase [Euryarchaeota archaeon]|nr:DHH family phosphoesterase [Euryarchaeota archaeon]